MDRELERYRSPVRLVLHAGEPLQPYTPQTLVRARKKLVAELSLSGGELQLDGETYTRNDVATLLQDLSEEQWSLHCLVYALPSALQFLEKADCDVDVLETELRPYRFKPGFPEFIAPAFAAAFRDATGRLIREVQPARLAKLLGLHAFVLPDFEEAAYEKLRRYFEGLLNRICVMGYEAEDRYELNFLYSPAWIDFMNALPPALAPERDEVATQLLALVGRLQHKATWAFLDQLCQRILLIHTSQAVKNRVADAAHIMQQNARRGAPAAAGSNRRTAPPPSQREGPGAGRIIFGVFWILVMIVRFASMDSCRSKSYSSYDDITRRSTNIGETLRPALKKRDSRSNEDRLLSVLDSLSQQSHDGKALTPESGSPPYASFTSLPDQSGTVNFTVRNETTQDLLFFWFSGDNLLLDSSARTHSVFIRKGGSYRFPMHTTLESRFAAAFGQGWVRLSPRARVPLRAVDYDMSRESGGYFGTADKGSFEIGAYFRKPAAEQPYLRSTITPAYGPSSDQDDRMLYQPHDRDDVHDEGTIRFLEEDGHIRAAGAGTYYLIGRTRID
ncbi:hypothetical protein [Flaviaesturariibacter terrae]